MKTQYKRLIVLCSVLVAVLVATFVYYFQNLVYVAAIQLFEPNIRLELVSVPTEKVSLSEIESDSRIIFDQSLMLINTKYKIPVGTEFDVAEYKKSGVMMNRCMIQSYADLVEAVLRETGETIYVSSHIRTREEQSELFFESPEIATEPGASEHETGLCLDIYVQYNAGDNFLKTDAGRFVNSKCHEYGFVIRYPIYGSSQTGIRFEPWHIRYVGKIHAKIIYANRLTLEEYIFSLKENVIYQADDFIITRQRPQDGYINVPQGYSQYEVSPDNTGCYIITVYS